MNIYRYLILIIALLCSSNSEMRGESISNNKLSLKSYNKGINITPLPQELLKKEGVFNLNEKILFVASDNDSRKIADFFAEKLKRSTGYKFEVTDKKLKENYILLTINPNYSSNKEAYSLNVTNRGIDIEAKTPQGLFHAMQTVLQLLPAEIESSKVVRGIVWDIPCVDIKDEPRFPHRGILFDVCRHFLDIDFLKKQIDVMAMFKINKLHWHLTDDQGWRIEIKRYPKLMEISSMRKDQAGNQYGPYFYTQEEIKELVAYAKERFIEVIPEIELPGHSVAALTAYPHLSCTGGPFNVRHTGGISGDVYCAGNEEVFTFLENVFDEVVPLFESDYIHIGGDEAPKVRWEKCAKCQNRIKEQKLKKDSNYTAEEKLQSYFVQRMEKYLLNRYNKKIIGWDEILEGGIAPSATIMSWRGEKGGIAAANSGHDVIMTPGEWLYVDKYQCDSKIYPPSMRGYVPLQKTYSYNPLSESIEKNKQHHVIGLQANMWAEQIFKPVYVENRLYPRAIAMSEIGWTPNEKKDYESFLSRLENIRVRLDMHNIEYYIPIPEQVTPSCNYVAFTDETTLELKSTEPVIFVYTIDGTEPNLLSEEYIQPIKFKESATVNVRSVLPSGKMGETRTIDIVKESLQPSVKVKSVEPGLNVKYYGGLAWKVADIDIRASNLIEKTTIVSPHSSKFYAIRYYEPTSEELFNTVIDGYINIEEDGIYYFSSEADHVWIGNSLVIDNEGEFKRFSRADKSIALAKGLHPIKIVRVSGTYGGWSPLWNKLEVSMRKSDEPKFEVLWAASFFRDKTN